MTALLRGLRELRGEGSAGVDGWRALTTARSAADHAGVLQKKVALLGAAGVGKTSLVRRFVESVFDDKYLTTIGVKVDKKQVHINGADVVLMLWDVAGAEERFSIPASYVRGAAGYLLVADGTRPETLEAGREIAERVHRDIGPLPAIAVLNKIDLTDAWRVRETDLEGFGPSAGSVIRASAKTGVGVEDAFLALAQAIVRIHPFTH
jgi:small GTP-binding protein